MGRRHLGLASWACGWFGPEFAERVGTRATAPSPPYPPLNPCARSEHASHDPPLVFPSCRAQPYVQPASAAAGSPASESGVEASAANLNHRFATKLVRACFPSSP